MLGQQRRHIARQRRLHVRIALPVGMVGDQAAQRVEGKRRLERDRVLGPQRPVVVEHRDPLGHRDELAAPLGGHLLDVPQQPLLDLARGPARQRIVRNQPLGHRGKRKQQAAGGQPRPTSELHERTFPAQDNRSARPPGPVGERGGKPLLEDAPARQHTARQHTARFATRTRLSRTPPERSCPKRPSGRGPAQYPAQHPVRPDQSRRLPGCVRWPRPVRESHPPG